MSIVCLCQCDLSVDYEHSMTFNNRSEQYNYIRGNVYKILDLNIPNDSHRKEFEVNLPIQDCKKYDYCIIGDEFSNIHYYFILGMKQKGLMTNVYVQIDLIQTYLFDWKIRDSFVDRGHVERWFNDEEPTQWLEDEGLEYGNITIEEIEKVTRIPLNFIICATTPIGNIDTSNESGDTGGNSGSGGNTMGEKIVNSARKLIGKPYVWGGNYPPLGSDKGTDCSGLCQWAYNDNGKKITRTTYTQIKEGREVSHSEAKAGDLVFMHFKNGQPEHVVLYSHKSGENHYCVEAPRTGLNIRERELVFTSEMKVRRLL